jgi:hypothetical protein
MSPSTYSRPAYNVQQIITLELMEEIIEGDKNNILRKNGRLILKEIEEISNKDLKFTLSPEEAWTRIINCEA